MQLITAAQSATEVHTQEADGRKQGVVSWFGCVFLTLFPVSVNFILYHTVYGMGNRQSITFALSFFAAIAPLVAVIILDITVSIIGKFDRILIIICAIGSLIASVIALVLVTIYEYSQKTQYYPNLRLTMQPENILRVSFLLVVIVTAIGAFSRIRAIKNKSF